MERPINNHPFKKSYLRDKGNDDTEVLNEHVQKFIEELEKGTTPQEAAAHAENFRNTKKNYFLEKRRHDNFWKNHL